MTPHIFIQADHQGMYYSFFYVMAFLVGFVLLLYEGRQRQFPTIPWMMVIATAFLFFIAGCRLIGFSGNEWEQVLKFERIPYTTARSMLGGIIVSILGIIIAKRLLRFRHNLVDAFALILPAALAVQRFGCLLAGCCYGAPSNLPWSIQYGPHTPVFYDHVYAGQISADAVGSLSVHPVQVYEVLSSLLIIFVLLRIRKRINTPGNLLVVSYILFGLSRFLLEFVRAPQSHVVGGEHLLGLNKIQWIILVVLPLLLLLIRYRKFAHRKVVHPMGYEGARMSALYFMIITLLFFVVSRWFNLVEIIAFNIVMAPMLVILAKELFTSVTVPGFRLASILIPLGALLIMSQTFPEKTKSDQKRSYTTFSGGIVGGHSNLHDYTSTTSGSGCNSGTLVFSSTTTDSRNKFLTGALGISRTNEIKADESLTYGINFFAGGDNEEFTQVLNSNSGTTYRNNSPVHNYLGIKPYFQYDWKPIGIGFGFLAGQMGTLMHPAETMTAVAETSFLPTLSLRVGNHSRFFLEYSLNNQFVPSLPVMSQQVGLGFRVGQKGGKIRLGSATYTSLYLNTVIPVGDNLLLEPTVGLGGGNSLYQTTDTFVGSFNLHYRFNRKTREK